MIVDFNKYKIYEEFVSAMDSYTSFNSLKKYKGNNIYIHFTDAEKLGVNPNKSHHDPHGVYFYPKKFIESEDGYTTLQYGYSMKYYYICKVDTKRFLNLNTIKTIDDIKYIFISAGYENVFNSINFADIKEKRYDKKFWYVLDILNTPIDKREVLKNQPYITWNMFFDSSGYEGLIDNKAVINFQEPQQIIVFNQKTIQILDFGLNKITRNYYNDLFDKIIKIVNPTNYKGLYKTKNNTVSYNLYIDINNKHIKLVFDFDRNNVDLYYVENNVLKHNNMNFNSFGENENVFISTITYKIKSAIENCDENKIVDDYFNENFEMVMNEIFNKLNNNKIFYENNEIRYQIMDYGFLKVVYNISNKIFKIEFYSLDGNDIKFIFEFKTYNEFKVEFKKILNDYIDKKMISDYDMMVDFIKMKYNMNI